MTDQCTDQHKDKLHIFLLHFRCGWFVPPKHMYWAALSFLALKYRRLLALDIGFEPEDRIFLTVFQIAGTHFMSSARQSNSLHWCTVRCSAALQRLQCSNVHCSAVYCSARFSLRRLKNSFLYPAPCFTVLSVYVLGQLCSVLMRYIVQFCAVYFSIAKCTVVQYRAAVLQCIVLSYFQSPPHQNSHSFS